MNARPPSLVILAAALFLAPALLVSTAEAHGGAYRAPRVPRYANPLPPGPGGTPTPPPPGGVPTPRSGGPEAGPGTGVGLGPVRGRPSRTIPKDDVDWKRWWLYNRDRYLTVREKLEESRTATPSSREDRAWRARAIKALIAALDQDHIDITTGAAIALGKASATEAIPALTKILVNERSDRSLRESCALALGMIGRPDSRATLETILNDGDEPRRLRAFAAISLGLMRSGATLPALTRVVREKKIEAEVRAAGYVALGLTEEDIATPLLADAARGKPASLDADERAAATDALGRGGDREAIDVLLGLLRDKKGIVRRGAILSLGRLVRADDTEAVRALASAARTERDRLGRAFAAIALGRTGSKEGAGTLQDLLDDKDAGIRGYAVLGLAIMARESDDPEARLKVADYFRRAIDNRRLNDDRRAAVAVALGILQDRKSVKAISKLVTAKGPAELRGHAAVALGMIGDREVLPMLRRALADERDPTVLRDLALGVGLLGDSESVRSLVKIVKDGRTEYLRGNAALALGRIGGSAAADAMVELLGTKDASGPTRGMAAVSLGYLLDERTMPALFAVVEDLDYRVGYESFGELLTIL